MKSIVLITVLFLYKTLVLGTTDKLGIERINDTANNKDPQIKFGVFLMKAVAILKSYKDADLENVLLTIQGELKKYSYHVFMNDEHSENTLRTLMNASVTPIGVIRGFVHEELDNILHRITNATINNDVDFVKYLDRNTSQHLMGVLEDLDKFDHEDPGSTLKMKSLIGRGIKNIFDWYSAVVTRNTVGRKSDYYQDYLYQSDEIPVVPGIPVLPNVPGLRNVQGLPEVPLLPIIPTSEISETAKSHGWWTIPGWPIASEIPKILTGLERLTKPGSVEPISDRLKEYFKPVLKEMFLLGMKFI